VVGVEDWSESDRGLDVGYRVRGVAGSPATTWLAAQNPSGSYVSGRGVEVGPGPFEAIVQLELTGIPQSFVIVLEVAGRRCRANAKLAE
jgi:hypothetical protein